MKGREISTRQGELALVLNGFYAALLVCLAELEIQRRPMARTGATSIARAIVERIYGVP
jgi:hypothetical protein